MQLGLVCMKKALLYLQDACNLFKEAYLANKWASKTSRYAQKESN